MAFQTIRKTGQLVGIAFALAAVMIAAVIGIIAVTSSDDTSTAERAGAAPAASRTPAQTSAQTTTPTSPPSTSQPAARSTTTDTTSVAPAPSTSPVANTSPAKRATASAKPKGPITYTVKKGDNLTVIAAWFKQHGYGKLYEQNRKVIGADPDLILPGQKITVSSAGMTTSR